MWIHREGAPWLIQCDSTGSGLWHPDARMVCPQTQAMLHLGCAVRCAEVFNLPAAAIMVWGYAPGLLPDFERHSGPLHHNSHEKSASSLSVGQYQKIYL